MSDLTPHSSGYMKPPKKNRFKRGKSGNPNGGPKQIDDPVDVLVGVLNRRVSVTGSKQRITMLEALTRKLRELALSGDRQAIRLCDSILKIAVPDRPSIFTQKSMEAARDWGQNREAVYAKINARLNEVSDVEK